jgi:DNA processing protein
MTNTSKENNYSIKDRIKEFSPADLLGSLNDVEQKYAPKLLYTIGNPELVRNNRCISVIGTRNPSSEGIDKTKRIVEFLVKNNIVVVSGLARGIDTIAHKTAIESGGNTIAVIGTPLDKYYPKENRELQDYIMNHNLLISQFKIGHPILPSNFPMRNRTMALISQISIIVEAGQRSGTMHQGWEALRLGRKLYLLDSLVQNKELKWPSKLIEYGAEILYMNHLDVILDFLPENIEAIQYVNF